MEQEQAKVACVFEKYLPDHTTCYQLEHGSVLLFKYERPYALSSVSNVRQNALGMHASTRVDAGITVANAALKPGQTIPKGACVNGDIHYLMADEALFDNPEEFRPERYIAEDGKSLRKDLVDFTLPFSIGKRACAGEGIARVELFLGLTATFQHYRLSPCEGAEVNLEPLVTVMVLQPHEQNLRIERI